MAQRIIKAIFYRPGPPGPPGNLPGLYYTAEEIDEFLGDYALTTALDALLPKADVLNEPDMATGATDKPPSQASVVEYVADHATPLEETIEEDIAFAVVDQDNHRTWIEAAIDGGPTSHSVAKIQEHIGGTEAMDTEASGLIFAVVDQDNHRTWIEADAEGKPSNHAARQIERAMGLGGVQAVSGPRIVAIGDSLTWGAGGTPYTTPLEVLTGRTVVNLGVGGESSATIAGRAGGRPWLATVSDDTIPASGNVTITIVADDGTAVAPLLQGSRGVNPVLIAGVEGTLSLAGGVYTFTRTTAGDAVTVARPAPVITAAMRTYRSDITIMWWGQNDSPLDVDALISRQRSTIEALAALDKRWLVIGLPTGTAASRGDLEARMLREYGRRFLNIRAYLSTYAALTEAGITPTSEDDTDIAQGRVPASLRADSTHLNTDGYARVAAAVAERLAEMGWL